MEPGNEKMELLDMEGTSTSRDKRHILGLDILKGVAIVMIIIVHTSQRIALPHGLSNIAQLGQLGCQLFFLISGFSLSLSYLKYKNVTEFYKRRYISLAPGYYLAILLSISVSLLESMLGLEPIAEISGGGYF